MVLMFKKILQPCLIFLVFFKIGHFLYGILKKMGEESISK